MAEPGEFAAHRIKEAQDPPSPFHRKEGSQGSPRVIVVKVSIVIMIIVVTIVFKKN